VTQAPDATHFDLDYTIEDDIPPSPKRDSQFIFARAPQLVTDKATEGTRGRVLDVGCAFDEPMSLLQARRWESWGLHASFDLVHYCRERFAGQEPSPGVAGTAESLPFRGDSLDRIVCQGSLDHFAQTEAFLREAARVLKPQVRLVIALANYDSLSCRFARATFALRRVPRRPVMPGRHYWEIPRNHAFRGTLAVLRRLAQPYLQPVKCRGVSLFWLFPALDAAHGAASGTPRPGSMSAVDAVAYRVPAIANMTVSVWRPRRHSDGPA
jgi:SAM-dependent methyltransferase